jgi:hypothetical protein
VEQIALALSHPPGGSSMAACIELMKQREATNREGVFKFGVSESAVNDQAGNRPALPQ